MEPRLEKISRKAWDNWMERANQLKAEIERFYPVYWDTLDEELKRHLDKLWAEYGWYLQKLQIAEPGYMSYFRKRCLEEASRLEERINALLEIDEPIREQIIRYNLIQQTLEYLEDD